MENLHSWLMIFSGAAIAFLGSFLFVSERELRNKRRELDEFKRKQTAKPVHSTTEEARSEAYASTELITRNEELTREISALSSQLNSSEARLQESVRRHEELSDRCSRLEEESADFKQQLEDSQAKAQEMDTAQQQLANVESREMNYREQQQRLEELVVELERELSEGKNQVQALEDTHERLLETNRVCQELSDENRQLREESSRWQQSFAASEENQREVSMLRRQLQELQAEHARLLNERQAQTGVAVVTEEMSATAVSSKTKPPTDGSNEIRDNLALPSSERSAAGIQVAKKEEPSWVVWTSLKQKWRFGAVPAMVIVVIGGAAAMGLLGMPFSTKEVAVAPATSSDEYAAKPVERVSKPPPKAAPRVRGTFETVRATQVYSGPTENSALIASIGPGTKLNVVDSSNGWLAVRSKHGRPPGFVRQEAAVRSGQN